MSKPTIKLFGNEYPLVAPPEFDLGELCDCENHFHASFDNDLIDARKLASILYVSTRRVDPKITPGFVLGLGPEELAEIQKALEQWQGDDAGPPESPGASSSERQRSEPSSSDEPATRSEPSQSSSGSRSSETSAKSPSEMSPV